MKKNKKAWISNGKKHWIHNGRHYIRKIKKRNYIKFAGKKYYIDKNDLKGYKNINDYRNNLLMYDNVQDDFIDKYVHTDEEFEQFPE